MGSPPDSVFEDHDAVFLRSVGAEKCLLAALNDLEARWLSNEKDPRTGIERQIPVTLE